MSTTSTERTAPTASVVSSLSDAPLYEVAQRAHAEKQAAFQAVAARVYEDSMGHEWMDPGQERPIEVCGLCHLAQANWDGIAPCPGPYDFDEARLGDSGAEEPHEHRHEYQTGGVFKCECGSAKLLAQPGTEPPLTPEEEEEVKHVPGTPHGLCATCWDGLQSECMCCNPALADEPWAPAPTKPAPPVRRPPYAVAYSVGGQLYEVALPGDATVTAVDGHLVIDHGAAVSGIVGIHPIVNGGS